MQGIPDKSIELLDNFMKAALVTQVVVIIGLGLVFLIVATLFLRRLSVSNGKMVDSLVDIDKEHKTQRDTYQRESQEERKKREEVEAERARDHVAFADQIKRFSDTLEADLVVKTHQLAFEQTRTQAYVDTAKALDEMRSDTMRVLQDERSNIEAITAKIETQSTSLGELMTASSSLPGAVADAVKAELADVHKMVERLDAFLDNFDQAKREVLEGITTIKSRLESITNRVGDPGGQPVASIAATASIPSQ